ncbi:MAG: hypothetical protein ACOY4H_13800 [Thermodesulfobacteriota bacterium]
MSLPSKQKNNTHYWDHRRGRIFTSKGGIVFGEAVYCHGYDMMEELVGQSSYFQVLILNATGKLPERRLADWLEALFICLSYPDARIWCNQIGSLAGSLQTSPLAALASGIQASDSRMYGPGTLKASIQFLQTALRKRRSGDQVDLIITEYPNRRDGIPLIPGFIRPVASGDERIDAMEKVTTALGYPVGPHLSLTYEIHDFIQLQYQEGLNLLGYTTAFLLDQGIEFYGQYRVLAPLVSSGVLACYAEAADQPPESFFPLQCGDIDYQGQPPRSVPDDQ